MINIFINNSLSSKFPLSKESCIYCLYSQFIKLSDFSIYLILICLNPNLSDIDFPIVFLPAPDIPVNNITLGFS